VQEHLIMWLGYTLLVVTPVALAAWALARFPWLADALAWLGERSQQLGDAIARSTRVHSHEMERLQARLESAPLPRGFRVAALTAGASLRCPYCHDDLGTEALLACECCATTFHAECARDLERCTTLGCGGSADLATPGPELHLEPRRVA